MNLIDRKLIKYLEISRLLDILENDIETETDKEKIEIYKQIYESILEI